ncbi:TonB-dependent receptor [Paracidobacterium acidisoli]|uniref:Carboxypeptidase regulatory-like domain-containing protein n=1 Tax=Paracidobacterium acidisoli TaxID=2303751 RepID=A0A372IJ17_9BACT|nr:carboxypeptidase-like regulatory domain-containing protein [Paracidobacterium acidisoli]MBT9333136.1 carboxypeptidase-like regulatory domain-containing protein [Paracidobacterium acidisoli]
MHWKFLRGLACLLIATAVSAFGQTARFTGQVTDQQGAAIPNAQVEILNLDSMQSRQIRTDSTGSYAAPYLPAGRYQITVRAKGFGRSQSSDLAITAGQAFVYNVQLTVGAAQSSVTVEGGSISSAVQVDTENAEVSGIITGKEVSGIQLNGRNYTQLLALTPGVSNQTGQDEARVGMAGSVSYSVNGGRTEYNSFQVDGSETLNVGINKDHTSLIVTPSIDAIQEIKVLTSNYGAQYPSTGDGTSIVTTKSGTDQYHGDLYEFIRNEMFNAKGYFDVTNGAPLYRRNDFGGTIGGPLSIPHLYDAKGRTHFFFSEETRLEKDPYAYRQGVPSLAERNGDFSDVCPYVNYGYSTAFSLAAYPDCPSAQDQNATHVTFPGNQIGGTNIAPVYRALMGTGIIPNPNAISGCNSTAGSCYNSEVSLPTYWREELFRIDQAIGDKTQASFRYIHDEYSNTVPVPQYGYVQNSFPTIQNRVYGPGLSMVARLISTFSPTLINDFTASYTDSTITFADIPGAAVYLARPAALSGTPGLGYIFNNGFGGKLPGIRIAGNNAAYGGFGFATDPGYMPWAHTNPVYSFSDSISKGFGRHALQFGAQWIIFQRNQINGPIGAATGDVQGLLTFSNQSSSFSTGNAFADFVDWDDNSGGGPSAFQQDSGQGRYYQRYQIVEPYFQDDWKVTSRLTVNAGIRVSLFGTYGEKNHNAYNWVASRYSAATSEAVTVNPTQGYLVNVSTGNGVPIYEQDGSVNPVILNGIVRCGAGGVPSGCMSGHLWNPAPRIGFAWNPDGNGKTAIRAGYGIFFEHGTANEANTGSLEGSAPMVLSMEDLNPAQSESIGSCGVNCVRGTGAFPLNVTSIPTRATWPYVQQWSLSVERQVSGHTLGTLGYVGGKGTHLALERQLNQLLPASNTINPFGAHDPMLTRTCQSYLDPGGGFDGQRNFNLPNGTVIQPQSPAYVNLEVACYGFGEGGTVAPSALRKYAPGMGQIYSLENTANASYHSLQATLRHISGPLTLGVAYTYSHSIDDASDRSDTTFVNSYDVKSNRASSNFDQRQLLHISYIYDMPLRSALQHFLSGISSDPNPENTAAINPKPGDFLQSRMSKLLLDHWQLSGLTLFETGIPFTVLNGGSANGVGVEDNAGVYNGVGIGSYPDKAGDPHGPHPKVAGTATNFGPLLLNPGAFAAPRGLTFGNAGRNSLNNPQRWNFDATLDKTFPLGESRNLEFRAEAFNVFNHTQFRIYDPVLGNQANNTVSCYGAEGSGDQFSAGDPGDGTTDKGCLTGNSFLHPVDAHRPRTIQFGLRLAF